MNIGIIGSGNVGGALGTRWAQKDHQVTFGSRTPDDVDMQKLLDRAGKNARAARLAEAAATNDVLLFSMPWPVAKDVLSSLGNLAGKVLIDATNPLRRDISGLTVGTDTSAAEQVADWANGARVVKCFNTVGSSVMENDTFAGGKPVMFYCGDDAAAKKTVHQLADDIGFDAQDAGPLAQARLLEPFAMLWISLAIKGWGRDFAFQVLRR
jgi:8-hydroxy-5-deazaflavin:NADPH oxidoreductase